MTLAVQPSLFDELGAAPALGRLGGRVTRTALSQGAWVDHLPGWLTGSDALFAELATAVPWRAERRQIHELHRRILWELAREMLS